VKTYTRPRPYIFVVYCCLTLVGVCFFVGFCSAKTYTHRLPSKVWRRRPRNKKKGRERVYVSALVFAVRKHTPALRPNSGKTKNMVTSGCEYMFFLSQKAKFEEFRSTADSVAIDEFKVFMGHPAVHKSAVWKNMFHALPPRGTLARIARRADAILHQDLTCRGWRSKKEFRTEIRRILHWYKPGRKQWIRRRGIRRGHQAGPWRKGRATVITKQVKNYLKVLGSEITLDGLFNWDAVARLLHQAGIPMQTGTVPVERLWANYIDFFPDAATAMSRSWWDLLNNLGYLRYNYRHYNHDELPTFTRGDALLAERIENLITLTRAMREDQDGNASDHFNVLKRSLDPSAT